MSNRHIRKGKNTNGLPAFLITAGVILCLTSFCILWNGCVERLRQADWTVVDATVIDVEEKTEGSLKPGKTGTHTMYEIFYEYIVNGNVYGGDFKQNRAMSIGDNIEIKYNPDAPQYSTKELGISAINIVIGAVIGIYGVTAVIASIVLAKKSSNDSHI